jgi:hypothetical protein
MILCRFQVSLKVVVMTRRRLLCAVLPSTKRTNLSSLLHFLLVRLGSLTEPTGNDGLASKVPSVSLWFHVFASHVLFLLSASCWFLPWLTVQPWRWRRHVPPKRRLTFARGSEDIAVHFRILLTRHRSSAWPTYTSRDSTEKHKYSSMSCPEFNPRTLWSYVPSMQLIPYGRCVRLVYIRQWASKLTESPID